MTMYVVTHKKVDINLPEGYQFIFVGDKTKLDFADYKGYLRGDMGGENIASKNISFCELTAMFWIYKYSKSDFIGISHYRRFF